MSDLAVEYVKSLRQAISLSEYAVCEALAMLAEGDPPLVHRAMQKLAQVAGISRRTAQLALRRLEARKIVETVAQVDPESHDQHWNMYYFPALGVPDALRFSARFTHYQGVQKRLESRWALLQRQAADWQRRQAQ